MSGGLSASAALILTILFLFFQSLTSVPTWWKYTAELLECSLKALYLSYSISLQFSTSCMLEFVGLTKYVLFAFGVN